MLNNLHFVYPFAGIELTYPPGAPPDAFFKPIYIPDDSLRKIGIYREDLLYAQLTAELEEGRFSCVETGQEILLGYTFRKPDEIIKVEGLCRAPCCPPRYVAPGELVRAAPVTWLYRHNRGITSRVVFDERRPELWET